MPTRIRSMLSAAALGLALTGSVANAQLLLSGHTTGSFDDPGDPNTTVFNAPDGSFAQYATGIPLPGSTQTTITFENVAFVNADATLTPTLQMGLLTIHNGQTVIGSGQPTAVFNLGVFLTTPNMGDVALSPITIEIDHTVNDGSVPDLFSVSYNQPAAINIDGYNVQFNILFDPTEFSVSEDGSTLVGELSVTATLVPIPEPSTYAACGALLLVGVVAYRRYRGAKSATGALPTAV